MAVPDRRTGTSLLEVLIAGLGLLVVVTLSMRAFAGLGRLAAGQRERSERLQTGRITRSLLRVELSASAGEEGVVLLAPDSVRLRAFRGFAQVCPGLPRDSAAVVVWSGLRRPEPAKDSVLVLGPDGDWTASDLVAVSTSRRRCAAMAGSPAELWTVDPPAGDATLLRLFEAGSYHLTDGALRYRSGRSGRQPLTELRLGRAAFSTDGRVVWGEWSDLTSGGTTRHFLTRLPDGG